MGRAIAGVGFVSGAREEGSGQVQGITSCYQDYREYDVEMSEIREGMGGR